MTLDELVTNTNQSFSFESQDDLEQVAQIIVEACTPFLQQINYEADKYILWRGLGGKFTTISPNPVDVMTVRKDRQPVLTGANAHKLSDRYFDEKFGIKGRSATTFVTGQIKHAMSYGRPYAVFPVGEFRFLWSPNVADMAGLFVGREAQMINNFIADGEENEAYQFVTDILDKQKYTTSNLTAAIASNNEVMIESDKILIVSYEVIREMKKQGILDTMDLL